MEHAVSSKDGRIFSAVEFEVLSKELKQAYKASLLCTGCNDAAWFRSGTKATAKVIRGAHFNSHHNQGECDHRTSYFVIDDGSESGKAVDYPIPMVTDYIVNLDDKSGGAIADVELAPIPNEGFITPRGGAVGTGKGSSYEANASRTLRQILSYLKRFPDFKYSDKKVEIYSERGQLKVKGTIKDVAVHFDDISPAVDDDRSRLFWGLVVDSFDETFGGIWLNASDSKSGLSVKVFSDIRDEFLDAFKINELDDLQGVHIMLIGKLHYTGKNNKPVIFCPFVNLVTMQKYKERQI